MALMAPTPPVPPKPPVMPGAGQAGEAGENPSGQPADSGNAGGHNFGVHITVNPPSVPGQGAASHSSSTEQRAADQHAQQGAPDGQNSRQNVQGVQRQPAKQDAREAGSGPDVAQQARQAAVQQLLGEDREEQASEAAVRTDAPWPIAENHVSFMSLLPFIIVFVAAFITFTLRSMGKKQGALPQAASKALKKAPEAAGVQAGAALKQTGGEPLRAAGQDTAPNTAQNAAAQRNTVKNEDKSKGRNFEMRI